MNRGKSVTGQIVIGSLVFSAIAVLVLAAFPGLFSPQATGPIPRVPGKPDILFVATPQHIVERLLEMAEIQPGDVVYDLGCGDGRFVITAAKKYGVRGVGIDIDPEMVELSRRNARAQGVEDLVEFREQDIFEADFRDATLVALFLLPDLNLKLAPKLQNLASGSRIISHAFGIEGYAPDRIEQAPSSIDGIADYVSLYRWTCPLERIERENAD